MLCSLRWLPELNVGATLAIGPVSPLPGQVNLRLGLGNGHPTGFIRLSGWLQGLYQAPNRLNLGRSRVNRGKHRLPRKKDVRLVCSHAAPFMAPPARLFDSFAEHAIDDFPLLGSHLHPRIGEDGGGHVPLRREVCNRRQEAVMVPDAVASV